MAMSSPPTPPSAGSAPLSASLLSHGAGLRLLGAALAVAALWLSVVWALSAA
jgi:hypothetical protein